MYFSLLILQIIALTSGAPTLPELPDFGKHYENLQEGLKDLGDSGLDVLKSKLAVVKFATDTSVNAAKQGVRIGLDYANGLEIEAALNKTEDAVTASKISMIETIFDVKRQAIRALASIKQQYTAALTAFINASIANLNVALESTQMGITASKAAAADVIDQISIDNAIGIVTETLANINATGNALLTGFVNTKLQLAEAAENFDSQDIVHNANLNIGMVVNATSQMVESAVDNLGVFDSIDTIVHSVAGGVPLKINSIILTDDGEENEDSESNDITNEDSKLNDTTDEDSKLNESTEVLENTAQDLPRNFN